MLGNANCLILDEPTNHLDIMSKEILEDALNHYEGTVLYVSHDRYFINRTASRILDLTAHRLVNYIGNYDYYLEKHDVQMAALRASEGSDVKQYTHGHGTDGSIALSNSPTFAVSSNKMDWRAQKEEQARIRKKENDLKKCEERIASLETRLREIDEEMCDPDIGTQVAKLQDLTREQDSINKDLEKLYEDWETLAQ